MRPATRSDSLSVTSACLDPPSFRIRPSRFITERDGVKSRPEFLRVSTRRPTVPAAADSVESVSTGPSTPFAVDIDDFVVGLAEVTLVPGGHLSEQCGGGKE